MKELHAILLLLNLLHVVFCLLLTRPTEHDLFSGRHFNELVLRDGYIKQSCVLVMYKPSCDSKLQEYKLYENLPSDYYLTFLKYDYETTPKYSWYHFDDEDDLYARYKPQTCLELFYFPIGSPIDGPVRSTPPAGKKISEIIWGLVKVRFSIRNLYGSDISVRLEVKKKVVSSLVLAPTHEEIAVAFVTHNLFVTEASTGKLIYALVIDLTLDGLEIAIDRYIAMDTTEAEWKRLVRQETEEENEKMSNRIHNTAMRYLLDMKQPAVLPTFTEAGYEIQKIPPFLLKELAKFYDKEATDSDSVPVSKKRQYFNTITLTAEITQKIDLILRISMEEWADTTLQFTKTYNIREHFNGSYVYGHLGDAASQIIGVMIVLKKELGEQEEDWPFEIIGHDGNRQNVTLNEGEALFYESATCLVSNPYPFKGEKFVTATLFYRPDDGWKWKMSSDGKSLLYGNEIKESCSIFATSAMAERSKQKVAREEL